MEIQAGKYYKTRDGQKAFIGAITYNPFRKTLDPFPARGWIEGDTNSTYSWTLSGSRFIGWPSEHDLIEEWRDPVTEDLYVYLYKVNGCQTVFHIATELPWNPPSTSYQILGSSKVTITEGRFVVP